jgi:hypothetical protein
VEYDLLTAPGKYIAGIDLRIPEDTGTVRLNIVDSADKAEAIRKGASYEADNYIDIALNRDNVYSYRSETETKICDDFTVTNLSITPFMIRIEGRSLESVRALDLPILAVFSDGSVIDLHRKGSVACEHEFYSLYVTHGVLLDAREITELRIGDTVIRINQ